MASRQSMMPPRNLSLTEELEKLEQSITLTLQEIDHNFSKAHRIVTGRIIPIVEQYAKHSDAVWEGSKFWKQFFEASANVSLSGYEEEATDHGDETADLTEATTAGADAYGTPSVASLLGDEDNTMTTGSSSVTERPRSRVDDFDNDEDEDEDGGMRQPESPTATIKGHGTTPGANPTTTTTTVAAKTRATNATRKPDQTTPGRTARVLPSHPKPSPFLPSATRNAHTQRAPNDPLLHRILDKNYRVQATPHSSRKQASTETTTRRFNNPALDSSPMSSPEMAAPQLRSEFFSPSLRGAPRTPGVSVQKSAAKGRTPRGKGYTGLRSARKTLFSSGAKGGRGGGDGAERTSTGAAQMTGGKRNHDEHHGGDDDNDDLLFYSDDDDGGGGEDSSTFDMGGMSPPKTMQFHVPQSRLMRTPAREASRRIVEDLLHSAGGGARREGDHSVTDDSLSELKLTGRYDGYGGDLDLEDDDDDDDGDDNDHDHAYNDDLEGEGSPSIVRGVKDGVTDEF